MAHANIQHPILLKRKHALPSARRVDESDAPQTPEATPKAARRTVREPDARPANERDLPPECWYG